MDNAYTTPFRIVAITGASATGKSTLTTGLLKTLRNAWLLTSVTTRQRRDTDFEGEYEYVSDDEFEAALTRGEFFSHTKVVGHCYGMKTSSVMSALNSGDVFLRPLTPDRIPLWRDTCKEKIAFLHLVPPPPFEIQARFETRGTPASEIRTRLQEAKEWENKITSLVADGVPIRFITGNTPASMLMNALRVLQAS